MTSAIGGGGWRLYAHAVLTPEKLPLYPLDRRMGEPQSRSGSMSLDRLCFK
jgi:hypothetical protein